MFSGRRWDRSRGQSLVGVLSAMAGSLVLFAVSAQLMIQMNRIKSDDELESSFQQMTQLVGLSLENPGSCGEFFANQQITYQAGAGQGGAGWQHVADPARPLVLGVLAPPTSTPQRFGPWAVQSLSLQIEDCKVWDASTGSHVSCIDAQAGQPRSQPTELVGTLSVTVNSTRPSTGVAVVRTTEKFPFLVRTPTGPSHLPSGVSLYVLPAQGACGLQGPSGGQPPANLRQLLCNSLCISPSAMVSRTGCWDPITEQCDLSYQTCDALRVSRAGVNRCEKTNFRNEFVRGGYVGASHNPCPPNEAAVGFRLKYPSLHASADSQMICRPYGPSPTNPSESCPSCAVRVERHPPPTLGSGAAQCLNYCGGLSPPSGQLTAWLHTGANAQPVSGGGVSAFCSCGTPKAGFEFCRQPRTGCTGL